MIHEYLLNQYRLLVNDRVSTDYGCVLAEAAAFSGGERNYDTTSVAGMRGELVSVDNYTSNLTIECTLVVLDRATMQRIRQIKQWLYSAEKVSFSDSPEVFYRVLKVAVSDITRETRRYGEVTVTFTCIPYEYRVDGQLSYMLTDRSDMVYNRSFFNPYDEARPIYTITGAGPLSVAVNGNSLYIQLSERNTSTNQYPSATFIIDTEKMIARTDGGELANTLIDGNYEWLYLQRGDNTIQIVASVAEPDVAIVPNWGYEI